MKLLTQTSILIKRSGSLHCVKLKHIRKVKSCRWTDGGTKLERYFRMSLKKYLMSNSIMKLSFFLKQFSTEDNHLPTIIHEIHSIIHSLRSVILSETIKLPNCCCLFFLNKSIHSIHFSCVLTAFWILLPFFLFFFILLCDCRWKHFSDTFSLRSGIIIIIMFFDNAIYKDSR